MIPPSSAQCLCFLYGLAIFLRATKRGGSVLLHYFRNSLSLSHVQGGKKNFSVVVIDEFYTFDLMENKYM